jgi:hypothetical protein
MYWFDATFYFFHPHGWFFHALNTICRRSIRGSAVGKIIGQNVLNFPDLFEPQVTQWVFEETYKGEKLTSVINREHENVK